MGNREQCREVLEQEISTFGAWYGVVSNAGITRDGAFPALSDEDWDSVIHTNLDSFYNVIHPCIMPMIATRKGGRIITLSSVSGVMEEAALKEAMSMIPMQRMGQADEVAGLASYLMSDRAGYVTRQVISINGGML